MNYLQADSNFRQSSKNSMAGDGHFGPCYGKVMSQKNQGGTKAPYALIILH